MGSDVEIVEGLDDPGGTEEVHLDGTIEWSIEAHRGRRVDHDVAVGQCGSTLVVEAEAVGGDITLDDRHPLVDRGPERLLAQFGDQPVEGVVAEDLTAGPLRWRRPLTGPNEENHAAVGRTSKEALDERRAEKAGRPGDGDSFAR